VSGAWTFQLSSVDADAGAPSIPRPDVIHASLEQVQPDGVLSLGRLVYGTLSSEDPGFFGTLTIPRLMNNNGSKTGSMLGCQIQLNLPLAMPVTDDNMDPGPLQLSLGGDILSPGTITGNPMRSSLILMEDPTRTPRAFAWTGTKQ
jgi:hypothetical protein